VVATFLLEGRECFKDTQVKANDVAKLASKLKSGTVHCFVVCFDQLTS